MLFNYVNLAMFHNQHQQHSPPSSSGKNFEKTGLLEVIGLKFGDLTPLVDINRFILAFLESTPQNSSTNGDFNSLARGAGALRSPNHVKRPMNAFMVLFQ